MRLFQRTPRGIELTAEGELLQHHVREGLEKIFEGIALVGGPPRLQRKLRLQVYVTVAVRWLIPRLASFRVSAPDVAIDLDSTIMNWDFDPGRADVGLVYAVAPHADDVRYERLGRAHTVLVCSPAIAHLVQPDRLGSFRKIEILKLSGDWDQWQKRNGFSAVDFVSSEQFDSFLLAIEAAVGGQGILVVPEFIVRDDLKARRLVTPVGSRSTQEGEWYLAYRRSHATDRQVLRLQEWLLEQFRDVDCG
jgi:LysR family glycine cleavage system transcriptional activator